MVNERKTYDGIETRFCSFCFPSVLGEWLFQKLRRGVISTPGSDHTGCYYYHVNVQITTI